MRYPMQRRPAQIPGPLPAVQMAAWYWNNRRRLGLLSSASGNTADTSDYRADTTQVTADNGVVAVNAGTYTADTLFITADGFGSPTSPGLRASSAVPKADSNLIHADQI